MMATTKVLKLFETILRSCKTGLLPILLLTIFQLCSGWLQAEEGWITYFQDDFEDGNAEGWDLDTGWVVELEGANYVLSGSNHCWAILDTTESWTTYGFKTKVKLINADVHLNYRYSNAGRYFVTFHTGGLALSKETPMGGSIDDLTDDSTPHSLSNWYDVEIVGVTSNIKVYVNDTLRLEYNDSNHLVQGRISFETLDNSHVHFDDVLVTGEPDPLPPFSYTWTRVGGPSGGLGYDVRIHPTNKNIMFVTDNPSGVNKSFDAGNTWTQRNEGITSKTGPSLDGIPVFCLTIDPNNPDIVWSGTQNARGIYKSTDGGETWTKKDNGVAETNEISFRNFGIHPTNSSIVFAGAEITTGNLGIEFDKTMGKIYKTVDGGENWNCVWEGSNLVRFILFDQTTPDVLYASTGIFDREALNDVGVGVLKSTDGGENWSQINNGITNLFIGFLEMHPTNSKILFAAAGNNAWLYPPNYLTGGVYRTTNAGTNWQQVLTGDIFTLVTFAPSDPDVIYAGTATAFFRSTNGGDAWQMFWKAEEMCWGPPGIRAGVPISAVVDPDDPYTIFANNYGGGNFKSTNGAQTWIDASKGYTGAALRDIAVNPDNLTTVYTIGRSGPFRSYDAGENWAGLGFDPATFAEWYAAALNPDDPQQLLISDEYNGVILRSTDGGTSWTEVFRHPDVNASVPTNRHGFKAISYAPSNSNIVYGGMSKEWRSIDGDMPAGPSFGMYKSTDGGQTWTEITNGLGTSLLNIHCVCVHPTDTNIVYIGTWKDGIFKTTDGGQSWALNNNGLTVSDVRSLAIDPQNAEVLYAGLAEGGGVFKSTDGAEQWEEINKGINIQCPSSLLPVGKAKQGMSLKAPPPRPIGPDYYSVPWTSVRSIVIDPTHPQVIYAADYNSGVYLSTDGGTNWVPVNEGLSTRAVTKLAISSDGKVVYAATDGEGVFRYSPDTDGDGLTGFEEYQLGTDSDNPDTDGDGMIDGHEILAGTIPTNSQSVLKLTEMERSTGSEFIITWSTVSNKLYIIDKSTNLLEGFFPLTNVPANPVENIYTDSVENS